MEPEDCLPCSQETATGRYPEVDEYNLFTSHYINALM
jgi:hypothetical protein